MPKLLHIAAVLSLLGLLSCGNSNGGGSEFPRYDVDGFWEGTLTPDNGDPADRFLMTFSFRGGEPANGSIQATVRFCDPAEPDPTKCTLVAFQATCPEQRPVLTGTVRADELRANVRGARADFIELTVEYSDRSTGTGRYEIVESDGACLGEVGDIDINRRVFD
jgi:hypothetical protein